MRKLYLVIFCIFVTFSVFCSDVEFTYSGKRGERKITALLNSDNIMYRLELEQGSDGKLKLKAPPFLNISTDSGLFVGEIRSGSFFYFAQHPMNVNIFRYAKQVSVRDRYKMSLEPTYSGIAKVVKDCKGGESFNFAAFNPIFNPASPTGATAGYKNDNVFAQVLYLDTNEKTGISVPNRYQPRWKTLSDCTNRINVLVGGMSNIKTENLTFGTAAFVDSIYDANLGFWGYTGWNAEVSGKVLSVSAYNRMSSNGSTTEAEQVSSFTVGVKKDAELSLTYKDELFPMPIYGGTSRKNIISYRIDARYRFLKFRAEHSFTIEESTGHNCESVYTFSTNRIRYGNNHYSIRVKLDVGRTDSTETFVKEFSARVKDKHAEFEFSDEKVMLTLSVEKRIGEKRLKMSVNQDREITMSYLLNQT